MALRNITLLTDQQNETVLFFSLLLEYELIENKKLVKAKGMASVTDILLTKKGIGAFSFLLGPVQTPYFT